MNLVNKDYFHKRGHEHDTDLTWDKVIAQMESSLNVNII